MRKILVFSSLLALAGGAYAAEQDQAAAGSDQQAASAQGAGDSSSMGQSSGMQGQSAADSSSSTLGQSSSGDSGQSSAQAEQKQSLPYDFAASKLIGKQVTNDQGEQIGSVSDVIVDDQDKVTHAVLGVGGFLGVGERKVAVPFDELQVQGDNVVYAGGDKEQLSQMPQFQYKEEQQQQAQQQTSDQPQEQQTAVAPTQPGQSQ